MSLSAHLNDYLTYNILLALSFYVDYNPDLTN